MLAFPRKVMPPNLAVQKCLACDHPEDVKAREGYMKPGIGPFAWNVYHRTCFRRLEAEGVL